MTLSTDAQLIIGKAYIQEKLIYTEYHSPTLNSKGLYDVLTTEYLDPQGNKFATIKSEFSKNKYMPDSFFEDFRNRAKEKIVFDAKNNTVYVEKTAFAISKFSNFKVEANAIHGQGFHNYVLNHFDELTNSKKNITIVVPNRNDFYRFVIKKNSQDDKTIQFIIYPNSFLLKQLISPIELTYSINEKKLLRFYGLSNIEDEKGNSQVVEIKYQ